MNSKVSSLMEEAWESFFEADEVGFLRARQLCLEALFITKDIKPEKEEYLSVFEALFLKTPDAYFRREDLLSLFDKSTDQGKEAELFLHKTQKYLNAYYQVDRFE